MSYDHSCHLVCINKLYHQAISSLDLLFVFFENEIEWRSAVEAERLLAFICINNTRLN